MINNYFKIILRNFRSDRLCSLIIIVGLAVGLAAGLMIVQYVHFEMSFDRQYEGAEDIYYTYMQWNSQYGIHDEVCHPAVAPLFKRSVPEVEFASRLLPMGMETGDETLLSWGNVEDQSYSREKLLFAADPDIFSLFGISFVKGDVNTALRDPYTVVLTSKLAGKMFRESNPLDQVVRLKVYGIPIEFKVVGVVEDPPVNSSLRFSALFSLKTFNSLGNSIDDVWTYPIFRTFVKLYPGSDPKIIEEKINQAAAEPLQKIKNDFQITESIRLFPFSDFHFYERYWSGGRGAVRFTGDRRIIGYFSILAALIVAISWANSINLTTARALRRAKEVGLRKVNGAHRMHIIVQFLLEFLINHLISLLLAFTLVQIFFGVFANAIGSEASWILWKEPLFWVAVILFLVSSTIVSGIYPAFRVSGYNPARVLKGNFGRSQSGIQIRSGLIVAQFVLAVLLLTSLYIVSRQFYFLQGEDIGMSPDQVLVIRAADIDTLIDRETAFQKWRVNIATENYVSHTSAGYSYPGERGPASHIYYLPANVDKRYLFWTGMVSENSFATMNVKFLHGRDFIDGQPGEDSKVIINEVTARELGFTDANEALGTRMIAVKGAENKELEIIGVISNFSVSRKFSHVGQVFFYRKTLWDGGYNYFLTKLSTAELDNTLSGLKEHWNSLFPGAPFDYFFLDTYFDTFYKDERQFAGVFSFFTIIGVVITCMGLFGLSLYNANSRTKEVGIRKSLGGSASSIMWLFSKEYIRLIVIAALIGAPLAIWGLSGWLKNYPNRISLNADAVVIPLVVTVLIAVLTVAYHTYKTAHANPVASLRSE